MPELKSKDGARYEAAVIRLQAMMLAHVIGGLSVAVSMFLGSTPNLGRYWTRGARAEVALILMMISLPYGIAAWRIYVITTISKMEFALYLAFLMLTSAAVCWYYFSGDGRSMIVNWVIAAIQTLIYWWVAGLLRKTGEEVQAS